MPSPLFNEAQHKRVQSLYLTEGRPPAEIASILAAENEGLIVTARQISEYASTRDWGKKRRELIAKTELKVAQTIANAASSLVHKQTANTDEHREFLESSVRIGNKAIAKAERILETSNSARDISSAVNAAAKGIAIVREAVGLETTPGSGTFPGSTNVFFNFARGPGSPFYRPPEPGAASPPDVERPTDVETVTQSEHTPAPSPLSQFLGL